MKAVILAGGRGERLRPITDTRPKPLVPVLARPVMDYCLSLLAHHGVTEAYVTTFYLADQIRHRYGEEAFGVRLIYVQEEKPMGTCGGVKRIEKELEKEPYFLVMSGDALCDFDLSAALRFHQEKGAHATVILSSVKTPLEYGVVLQDTLSRIFAFSEKPDWSETLSDLVNTGVYILSPKVLKKVPEGEPFDFARDLFPLLIREGYSLFGYKDEGYWCDIGKIPALYRCNMDLMQGKAKTYLEPCGSVKKTSDGHDRYFVSHGALVEKGAEICRGSVISPGAHLAAGSRVSGSIVMENTRIRHGALVKNALICENCSVGEEASILSGTVLGAGSVAQAGASSEERKKYPPDSVLSRSPAFAEEGLVFTEKGVCRGEEAGLDREDAERLGIALAGMSGDKVGVLWEEKEKKSAYFAAVAAGGVARSGKEAVLLGEGAEEMASFAAAEYAFPVLFVSESGGKGVFFVFGKDGLPLLRREVLNLSRRSEDDRKEPKGGELSFRRDLKERYIASLSREMGEGGGRKVGFFGPFSEILKQAARDAGYLAYDGMRKEGLCLEVFHREMKVFLDGRRLADTEKARLFVLEKEIQRGRRIFFLPRMAPRCFSEHVALRGGKTEFFSLGHTCREETRQRCAASRDRWLYDQAHLAARTLSLLSGMTGEEVREEYKRIPEIYISSLRYEAEKENQARLLALTGALSETGKKVRVQPGFFGMKIISEASSFEAALDNALEYRGKLNEMEQKLRGN